MARTKSRKKGQAALEYLTTYGWLLIIIIIVAAAMAGLGLFKKSTFQPAVCSGFVSGLAYVDHKVDSNKNITLVLTNSLGKQITAVRNVTMTLPDGMSYTDNTLNAPAIWDAGDKGTITANAGSLILGGVGTTYSVSITIIYDTEGLPGHVQAGTCAGKIE
ncbi:MAG: hypothetical protein V1839_01380 [archaeon]